MICSSTGPRMNSANMLEAMCQISTWVKAEVITCHQAPSAVPGIQTPSPRVPTTQVASVALG